MCIRDRYQKRVHALAWRKIGDFHIAEDITQEAFLQVYRKLATLMVNRSHFAITAEKLFCSIFGQYGVCHVLMKFQISKRFTIPIRMQDLMSLGSVLIIINTKFGIILKRITSLGGRLLVEKGGTVQFRDSITFVQSRHRCSLTERADSSHIMQEGQIWRDS